MFYQLTIKQADEELPTPGPGAYITNKPVKMNRVDIRSRLMFFYGTIKFQIKIKILN